MDGLSRVNEPVPDVGAAERAYEARRQAGGRQKGTARRRAKRERSATVPASDDEGGSPAELQGDRPSPAGSGGTRPADQDRSEACYGRDKTVAPIRQKGRVIDIAI